jgi:hypothetical protein
MADISVFGQVGGSGVIAVERHNLIHGASFRKLRVQAPTEFAGTTCTCVGTLDDGWVNMFHGGAPYDNTTGFSGLSGLRIESVCEKANAPTTQVQVALHPERPSGNLAGRAFVLQRAPFCTALPLQTFSPPHSLAYEATMPAVCCTVTYRTMRCEKGHYKGQTPGGPCGKKGSAWHGSFV